MTQHVKAWVCGAWITTPSTARVFAPHDQRVCVASYPLLTADHVHQAVASAEAAQKSWASVPLPHKAQLLERVATLLENQQHACAAVITAETGKTTRDALAETHKACASLRYVAQHAYQPQGHTFASHTPGRHIHTTRIPLGVVGVITPWNFPLAVAAWKLAPALLAGNSVVFKPSEHTPLSAQWLVNMFLEAGLPPHVLHCVTGTADTVGEALVNHPKVAALSFTGSTRTGHGLYAKTAARGARALCEMGGKNPLVVLDDADIPKAAQAAVDGAFASAGQRCTATGLVICTPQALPSLQEHILTLTRSLRKGLPEQPHTQVSPCIHRTQQHNVLQAIEQSVAMGATLLQGGHSMAEEPYTHGCYIEPTVLDHVSLDMPAGHQELFGPVLNIMRAHHTEHAFELANHTHYGLSASVYTQNIHTAHHAARTLRAGILHINGPTMGSEAHAPFGGVNNSSVGGRENGPSCLDFYTDTQTVYTEP